MLDCSPVWGRHRERSGLTNASWRQGTGTLLRKIIPDVIRGDRLLHLAANASVRDAAKLMHEHDVGCVLIMENSVLLGIFTERDLVKRVVAESRDPDSTRLGEVMTANPDTIAAGDTAIEALRRMDGSGYRHLPVVHGGRVVGVVSRRDFSGFEKARIDDETDLWERLR